MAAVHTSSEPLALAPEDTARNVGHAALRTATSRQPAASDSSLLSAGSSAAASVPSRSPYRHRLLASSSLPSSSPDSSASLRSPPSLPSLPYSSSLPLTSRAGRGPRRSNSTTSARSVAAASASVLFPPLFSAPASNTTPETSLVGAQGKSIPLGDNLVAHRTSALRELNNTFPSPVFRHRATKSAGTTNTTYSQPVIVKTYSGPSPSPSASGHYRKAHDTNRASSHTTSQHRIPFASGPIPSTTGSTAVSDRSNATGLGWVLRDMLFSMGRTKGKSSSLIAWPWPLGPGDTSQQDEAKLPPLEAFSFKGIMADLQATTDIRSDLDRIAEICARSRYSLSNQYDAHVPPHGSGAAFVDPGGQPATRPRGQRRGLSHSTGPTLQPSEDDGERMRGQRRRRGGVGGTRRRSAAYGTLETIMSSSRSSEEDKTKKKSAGALIEQVRGRASKAARETNGSHLPTKQRSKSPAIAREAESRGLPPTKTDLKPSAPTWDKTCSDPSSSGARTGISLKGPETTSRRKKPTSFAHAVMDSGRAHRGQLRGGAKGSLAKTDGTVSTVVVPTLLSDLALPQASDDLVAVYGSSDGGMRSRRQAGDTTISRLPSTLPPPTWSWPVENKAQSDLASQGGTDTVDEEEGDGGQSEAAAALGGDASATGFLSGLSKWVIPRIASNGSDLAQSSSQPKPNPSVGAASKRMKAAACVASSHAEGSLRELLKGVDASQKKNKGKAVEREN